MAKNVLIGDVWLASGQSNMEWNLLATEGYDKELKSNKISFNKTYQNQ